VPVKEIGSVRTYEVGELFSGHRQSEDTGGIFDGTVGWRDGKKHYDFGKDGDTTIPLVKVTLFEGFRPSAETPPQNDGRAHGHQILCRTAGPMHYIPPNGAQVVVAVPAKRMSVPGGGMILGTPNEARRYADEATFIRANTDTGVISLFTTEDNTPDGKSVFFQVKPDGFIFNFPHGKLTFNGQGFHLLHSSGARIDLGAIAGLPAPLDALGSYVSVGAQIAKIEAAAIALGPAGGAAEPVAKATTLIATLGQILAALDAATSAIEALKATAAPSGAAGAEAAFAAAMAALATTLAAVTTSLGAAPVAMASQSTAVV